jgi:hypothetical protein
LLKSILHFIKHWSWHLQGEEEEEEEEEDVNK